MGPHGVARAVQRLEFNDCRKGLGELSSRRRSALRFLALTPLSAAGVKIVGGYREPTGEEFGIYVKRVVIGGPAALDGASSLPPLPRSADLSVSLTVCHSLFQVGLSQVT